MKSLQLLTTLAAALSAPAHAAAAEKVLGAYIFHRHGDRTAKAWEPVNLTALGADEVFSSGGFYRARYVNGSGALRIAAMSPDVARLSQLSITSPVDDVLHSSALVFAQALYPPLGATQLLANGSKVEAPLGGYQYVPVYAVADAASGGGAESSAWLQASSGCDNAEASSNEYLLSELYNDTLTKTASFYKGLAPVVNSTFSAADNSFKNAYTIFDLINVAMIHNSSIPGDDLLTKSTVSELSDLASTHEWNLAYNSSSTVRAIAGAVLAGQIVDALEVVVNGTADAAPITVQFGAYGTFMSFFGLANLTAAGNDFYGICDYASSMTFELVTNATGTPTPDDVSVRFYFANGTAAANPLGMYPLFGQDDTTISWNDFKAGMDKFSVKNTPQWCDVCGNTDGSCAKATSSGGSGSGSSSGSSSGSGGSSGVSRPVAGVIGALVTLVVILALEGAVMLIGGLRLAKKSTLAAAPAASASGGGVKA